MTSPRKTVPLPQPRIASSGHRLAKNIGILRGSDTVHGGSVWLESGDNVCPVIWPRGYRARFDPLELLDERGEVVAVGGEAVKMVGGFRGQDANDEPFEHMIPGLERAFIAHRVVKTTSAVDGESS